MSTRIYLPYGLTPTPALSPPFDAAWEKVGTYRYRCSPVKQGTPFTEVTNLETSSVNPYDAAVVQFVSGPLQAQTISGTVAGQLLCREANAAADFGVALVIRVVTALGIDRGTLLSYFPAVKGTEFSNTFPTNTYFPPAATALSDVTVEEGDRLVIELGFRSYNAVTTSYAAYLTIGDAEEALDLPADEAETAYMNPWIEFSGDLVWVSETNLTTTNGYYIGGNSELGGVAGGTGQTDFDVDNQISLFFCGDSAIESIPPKPCELPWRLSLTADSQIENVKPTEFVVSGFWGLSSSSPISSHASITLLFAIGNMVLGGRSDITDGIDDDTISTRLETSGGFQLISLLGLDTTAPEQKVTTLAAAGGYSIEIPAVIGYPVEAPVVDLTGTITYLLGGQPASGSIHPLLTALVAMGGYSLSSPGEEQIFEAWVLSGQAFEPSIWSAFNFNSFAQRGTQAFAAGEDGIYLLGGDDDAGEAFHTGARIGPANFGSDREKRLRGIQMGNCGLDTKVRVVAEMGDRVFTPDIDSNRVVVSRDIQGREFTIDIQDFQELSHFEATILKLARR